MGHVGEGFGSDAHRGIKRWGRSSVDRDLRRARSRADQILQPRDLCRGSVGQDILPSPIGEAVVVLGDLFVIRRIGRVMRHKTEMQGHHITVKQLGKVGDLLHLGNASRTSFRRNESDGSDNRGNIGITFSVETAKHVLVVSEL